MFFVAVAVVAFFETSLVAVEATEQLESEMDKVKCDMDKENEIVKEESEKSCGFFTVTFRWVVYFFLVLRMLPQITEAATKTF